MKYFILCLFAFLGCIAFGQNKSWGESYTIKHYYENGKLVKADTIIQKNQNGRITITPDFGLFFDTDSLENGWVLDHGPDIILWDDVDAFPSFATDSLMIIHREMMEKHREKMKQMGVKFHKKFKDAYEIHKGKTLRFFFDSGDDLDRLDNTKEKFQTDSLLKQRLERLEQKLETLHKRLDEKAVKKT